MSDFTIFLPAVETISPTIWDDSTISTDAEPEQDDHAYDSGGFASLPSELNRAKTFTELQAALKDHLYRTQKLRLWKCLELKEVSNPGESEGDFRTRITHGVKESRDLQVEKLRTKYAPKLATLQEQLRKAYQRVEKEKTQASQATTSAVISMGTSILSAVFGRKLASATNINKAASTMRTAGRMSGAKQDVALAEETVGAIQQRLDDLSALFEAEATSLIEGAAPVSLVLEEVAVAPKKTDITIVKLALC